MPRAPLPAPRGRGPCPWLRPSGPAVQPKSRRTCAATRTVARSAAGDFPRELRVFRFPSALWARRVLGPLARGCGWGSWEGRSGAFLEPSALGLNPPSSGPGFAVSAPARAPSDARGYPCTARALRGHGNAPSYCPNILCPRVFVRSSAAVLIAALVSPKAPSAAPAQYR